MPDEKKKQSDEKFAWEKGQFEIIDKDFNDEDDFIDPELEAEYQKEKAEKAKKK